MRAQPSPRWLRATGRDANSPSAGRPKTYAGLTSRCPTFPVVAGIPDWQLSVSVHQASGMAASQLGTDVAESLRQMKALADSTDETLEHVARAILDRTIRFDG